MECPLGDSLLSFIVVVSALIVIGNRLSGMYEYVIIPLGTIICLLEVGSGVGGVSFA